MYPRVVIQKNGKIKLWIGPINLTLNTSILSEYLNKEDNFFDPNQYKILGKKKQESEPTEEKIERESQKPLWFEINKQQFEKLRREVYNNQDNKNFKITINKKSYDWKMQKNCGQKWLLVKSLRERQKIVPRIDTRRHWCNNKRKNE